MWDFHKPRNRCHNIQPRNKNHKVLDLQYISKHKIPLPTYIHSINWPIFIPDRWKLECNIVKHLEQLAPFRGTQIHGLLTPPRHVELLDVYDSSRSLSHLVTTVLILRIQKCLTTHLSYHQFLSIELLVPSYLTLKATNHKDGTLTLLKVLHSCLMFRYIWESRCLRHKSSTFKPCHIIFQLGSRLDSVDGVKAMFLESTFRLS